jgi:hypothetical protein
MHERVSLNNKKNMDLSKIKVMLVVFFDWKGTVYQEFVPCGQMVNKQLYQEVLAHLRYDVCMKRPELWENQSWMFHHDDEPAHMLLLIFLAVHQTPTVPHPPYSPDILKGHHFQAIEEIQEKSLIQRTACARAQFSGCSSMTNAHSKTGQTAVCCQNLMLGALSSHSVLSVLVAVLFKKFSLFLNMPCITNFTSSLLMLHYLLSCKNHKRI